MRGKQRVSATVDAELLAAAEAATKRGEVATVTAWVNDAMRLKLEHDRRLGALAAFVADYEGEHGEDHGRRSSRGLAREARRRAVPRAWLASG